MKQIGKTKNVKLKNGIKVKVMAFDITPRTKEEIETYNRIGKYFEHAFDDIWDDMCPYATFGLKKEFK